MITGLQDAFNLAWKLAYVIKQLAKPEILDTYPTERYGISRGFARYADTVFRLFTSNNEVVKFIRVYILMALVKVLFPLVEKRRKLRKLFFKSVSQIGIHYQNSILSYRESEGTFSRGAPNCGDRLPYIDFFSMERKQTVFALLGIIFAIYGSNPFFAPYNQALAHSFWLRDQIPDDIEPFTANKHD